IGPEEMRVEYVNALTPEIGGQGAHDTGIESDPALQGQQAHAGGYRSLHQLSGRVPGQAKMTFKANRVEADSDLRRQPLRSAKPRHAVDQRHDAQPAIRACAR